MSKPLPPSQDKTTLELKLRTGMEITLKCHTLQKDSTTKTQETHRTLILKNAGGAQGIVFQWKDTQQWNQLSLPNTYRAQKMTLPTFWPQGELFLSQSAGIWLSDQAFDSLRHQHQTLWQPGLLFNPLLGPWDRAGNLETTLRKLGQRLERNPDWKNFLEPIKIVSKPKKFPLKINDQMSEVEVFIAENALGRYTILHNVQNPLIVEFSLAPKLKNNHPLYPFLASLKDFTHYRVESIKIPLPTLPKTLSNSP